LPHNCQFIKIQQLKVPAIIDFCAVHFFHQELLPNLQLIHLPSLIF